MLGERVIRLSQRGIVIRLTGLAGVAIQAGDAILCIDVLGGMECTRRLYTHCHPGHAPGGEYCEVEERGGWLPPGDETGVGIVRVISVPAYKPKTADPAGRHPRGSGSGYLVDVAGTVIYHMGDTGLIDELADLPLDVDVLLAPLDRESALSPEEALEVIRLLRPPITLPIHVKARSDAIKLRDMAQPYTQFIIL